MTRLRLSGAVLAGGRSTRMGTDKARLVVDGETLLARQLRRLAEAGVTERWVSVAAGQAVEVPAGVRVVADGEPDLGPLAGLESCLAASADALLLVLAVDLPDLTPAFLDRLVSFARPDCGVVPVRTGFAEPLAAIYPRRALPEIAARLQRRELALQPLIRAGLAAGWLRALELEADELGCLANWNRPEDLRVPKLEGSANVTGRSPGSF